MRLMTIFLGLALLGLVLPGVLGYMDCTDPNQIIMRISGQTNAHGSLWDGGSYSLKLCYGDLFDGGAPSDPGIHSGCNDNSDGVIMHLNQADNSHAEISDPSGPNRYSSNVCYSGLKNCQIVTSDQACSSLGARYKVVASLARDTNAHIWSPFGNFQPYPDKICCQGLGNSLPTKCGDFVSKTTCEDSNGHPGLAQLDSLCPSGLKDSCQCVWDGAYCQLGYTPDPSCAGYHCVTVQSDGACDGSVGWKTTTLTSELLPSSPTPPATCTSLCQGVKTVQTPCNVAEQNVTIKICADLLDSSSCAASNAWKNDPGCPDGLTCSCAWSQDRCGLVYSLASNSSLDSNCQKLSCQKSMVGDYANLPCSDGFKKATMSTTIVDLAGTCGAATLATITDASCKKGTEEVKIPCGFTSSELGFFDWTQFIISAVLIGLFYFQWGKMKNA